MRCRTIDTDWAPSCRDCDSAAAVELDDDDTLAYCVPCLTLAHTAIGGILADLNGDSVPTPVSQHPTERLG